MASFLPILYSFRRCPYAMRARLALYSAQIDHEHREVDLKNKPSEMLVVSPKGTVPVLQLTNGTVLEQSLDIMKWAFNTSQVSREDMPLIMENDTLFKQALDRYKYPQRYLENSEINYREQCEQFLRKLEKQLHPYLTGDTATLTDMAVFPFVRQFSKVDSEWFNAQPYPCLRTWMDSFTTSLLFQQVMEKHPLWISADQPNLVIFENSPFSVREFQYS